MNILEEKFRREAIRRGYTILGKGWPDYLVTKGNVACGIEVKSIDDCLSEEQVDMLLALDKGGIKCYVYKQIEPDRFTTIHIHDVLESRDSVKRSEVNWKTKWEEGRGHLVKGTITLKNIGLSKKEILRHVQMILSASDIFEGGGEYTEFKL